jgi:hypothetical protein
LEQNLPTQRQGVSAALAAARAQAAVTASVGVPGADSGRSLADMAQRDLDAALQLLADRAQYITGASGAAIALRRDGHSDMLCRASAGTNAPELGALLSTEVGLSGESVQTRQLMRCDDAQRDARVNREVCRQMGIASVLVMPVVNDDQVLGVFELFSGKANAFGERDLSAVQRLSEMVETAVRMAHATENLNEQLSARESQVAEAVHPDVFEGQFLSDLVVEEDKPAREGQTPDTMRAAAPESPLSPAPSAAPERTQHDAAPQQAQAPVALPAPPQVASPPPIAGPAKKPLFWSAIQKAEAEAQPGETDQCQVPPMLRGLRKCEACGFPVSAGRVLCVECEEKKWRGQLRPQSADKKAVTAAASIAAPKSAATSFAGAAPSMAKIPAVAVQKAESGPKLVDRSGPPPKSPVLAKEARSAAPETQPAGKIGVPAEVGVPERMPNSAAPEFVLSAGLEPSRSWFSANKFVIIVLLVIAGAAAAFFLLR